MNFEWHRGRLNVAIAEMQRMLSDPNADQLMKVFYMSNIKALNATYDMLRVREENLARKQKLPPAPPTKNFVL
jgi:hypothetical protein